MIWWLWIFLGLILLGVELMTPGGFYILFFGLAALAVGALVGFQFVHAQWVQWLLFSLLSVTSLLLFRNPLRRLTEIKASNEDVADGVIGETALLHENLAPGALGKAELRGTIWNARNAGVSPLSSGQRGRVTKVDGLTLWIKAE
jgi:membrane protein implicated in regulation of membrane protease activity